MAEVCSHLQVTDIPAARTPEGCEDCLAIGSQWFHLRLCLSCGKVGCCDQSPNRHARAHATSASHPAITSFEPGEDWGYCFPDDVYVEELGKD